MLADVVSLNFCGRCYFSLIVIFVQQLLWSHVLSKWQVLLPNVVDGRATWWWFILSFEVLNRTSYHLWDRWSFPVYSLGMDYGPLSIWLLLWFLSGSCQQLWKYQPTNHHYIKLFNSKISYTVVLYVKSQSESLNNVCSKHRIQVYFRGGRTIKNLLMASKEQGGMWWRVH